MKNKKTTEVSFSLALKFMLLLAAAMLFLSVLFIGLLNLSVKNKQSKELRESAALICQTIVNGNIDDLDFITLPYYYITYTVYDESKEVLFTNDSLLPLLDSNGKVKEYFEKDYFIDSNLNVRFLTQKVSPDGVSSVTVETAIDIENDSAAKMLNEVPRLVLFALLPVLLLAFAISYLISKKTISAFKKLRQDYDRERTFTSNVSHELKTPISIIDGHANLIKRWGKDDVAQFEESINTILRETQNMNGIVSTLLELSKLEEGQVKVEKATIVVNDFFKNLQKEYPENVVYENSEQEELAGVQQKSSLTLYSDEQKLHQIFIILISNSLKFAGPECKIMLSAIQKENTVDLIFTDDGPGFESQTIAHIFERFYKGNQAHTYEANKSGSGLGLSIAKTLCDLLGAQITAQNNPSGGAQIIIEF